MSISMFGMGYSSLAMCGLIVHGLTHTQFAVWFMAHDHGVAPWSWLVHWCHVLHMHQIIVDLLLDS
jgi:hypothetical protein